MSGKTYLRNENYFKRNYYEALKYILPSYLYVDDTEETPKSEDISDLIINSHIDIAQDFSSLIYISAIPDTLYSNIGDLSGIANFFIKQNELTNITTKIFEDKILRYFTKRFEDFENEEEFSQYLEDTLLPAITLNNPDTNYFEDLGESSAIHNYLINNLSWLYFLNTSGDPYSPSAAVKDLIATKIYRGQTVKLVDSMKALSEYIWKNSLTEYYPSSIFVSGTRSDLSGTQQLDKLKTWMDIVYSPLFSDNSDFKVRDKFEDYIDSNIKATSKIEDGPFARLIRALSFLAFDISNETEMLTTLYDIDDCPDDYLPLMAQLIGWDLFGSDPQRWRVQLRNAVTIYKQVGTKKAVQSSVNNVFPKDSFPIESRITELWESYVPYLLYYCLATESEYFEKYENWNSDLANSMNVGSFAKDLDTNIRLAVDRIIFETAARFPERFPISTWIAQTQSTFNYRDRDYGVPPFEEYPYYVNVELNQPMVEFMTDRLVCFGVSQDFALQFSSFVTENALNVDDEIRAGSWLIFTSGYNSPPNLDSIIANINNKNINYASLWSGKSSHFKLMLSATEFDFTKTDLRDTDSRDAIGVVSKALRTAAPAHAIPLLTLEVSDDPDQFNFSEDCLPLVSLPREEIDVAAGNNTFASGIFLNTYKRGINTAGAPIGRSATESLVSPELIGVSSIGDVPRNTSRRRNYAKIMPFEGYYDRTGFNMPIPDQNYPTADGDFLPLGLNVSSNEYVPVGSHLNVADVYKQCENLNSKNVYNGVSVSSTYPIRGW